MPATTEASTTLRGVLRNGGPQHSDSDDTRRDGGTHVAPWGGRRRRPSRCRRTIRSLHGAAGRDNARSSIDVAGHVKQVGRSGAFLRTLALAGFLEVSCPGESGTTI